MFILLKFCYKYYGIIIFLFFKMHVIAWHAIICHVILFAIMMLITVVLLVSMVIIFTYGYMKSTYENVHKHV